MDCFWNFIRYNYLFQSIPTLSNEEKQNLLNKFPNESFDEYIKILTYEEKQEILNSRIQEEHFNKELLKTNDTIFVIKKDIIIITTIDVTIKKGFYYKLYSPNIKNNWIFNIIYIWVYFERCNNQDYNFNSFIWHNNRLHKRTVESILIDKSLILPNYYNHNFKSPILSRELQLKIDF